MKSAYDRIAQKSIALQNSAYTPANRHVIREALQDRLGEWVSARDLAQLAIEYKRPIHELRHIDGLTIENDSVWVKGKRHGYYRIPRFKDEPAPELPEKPTSPRSKRKAEPTQVETTAQTPKIAASELPFLVAAKKSLQPLLLEVTPVTDVMQSVRHEMGVR